MLEKNQILQERYQIIRPLGHGGMGTVYEAKDTKLFGKPVALKEIFFDKITNQKDYKTFRRAFEREAKILTQLQHEAFPQVIDYFVENKGQFLVMELIQGKDIGELLKKRKTPFEIEDVLKWTNQILDALDYLHSLNPPTIHRDIKPQNLKINSRNKIKLLDFGIAKGSDFPANVTLTNHTFVAATFNYSPFEQIFRVLDSSFKEALMPFYGKQLEEISGQTADARSDIFSLGATLYHLLTKQLPFDSLKRGLEIWAGNIDPLPNPQTINPNISTELSDWILKAMEVDREKRFDSALSMKNALREVIEGDKIREESTRKLKLKKEQELLRMEREALAEERLKLEEARKRYEESINVNIEDAQTIRDLAFLEKYNQIEEAEKYKTNTSLEPEIDNSDSVLTIQSEEIPVQNTVTEGQNDITETKYLVKLNFEDKGIKDEELKPKEPQKNTLPAKTSKNKSYYPKWVFPIAIAGIFLFGFTVWGIFAWKNDVERKGIIVPETNSNTTPPFDTPVVIETNTSNNEVNVVDTNTSVPTETPTEVEPIVTPKPFVSHPKTKNTPEPIRQATPSPTPILQKLKTPTPKPIKTSKPKGNPDCIFNNDCR